MGQAVEFSQAVTPEWKTIAGQLARELKAGGEGSPRLAAGLEKGQLPFTLGSDLSSLSLSIYRKDKVKFTSC